MPVRVFAVLFGAALVTLTSAASARDIRALYKFAGGADGNGSVDRLFLDPSGNLYGVTPANDTVPGTVFMVSQGGAETVLHTFVVEPFEAADPTGGVVMDAAGNLYGEAIQGGQFVCSEISVADPDCGSIYKLATDGTLTTLYSFQGGEDGGGPTGGLLIDTAGNLYGTTKYDGSPDSCLGGGGCGTVFKLAPDGTKTILYNFAGNSDGAKPTGALIADGQGNLYGTTTLGGLGQGTVFKLASNGTETILHKFTGSDGSQPSGGLVMDASGNLYGTTPTAGNGTFGEVYKLSTAGTLTPVHEFTGAGGDGAYPNGGLGMDKKGNIYGSTIAGGAGCKGFGCGTVFRIARDGTSSQLAGLKGKSGRNPLGGVVVDRGGHVYGSALQGGRNPNNLGLLYSVKKK